MDSPAQDQVVSPPPPTMPPPLVTPSPPVSAAADVAAQTPPPSSPSAPSAPAQPSFPPVAPRLKEQLAASGQQLADKKIAGIDVVESDKVAKEEGDEYWLNYAREIELEKELAEVGGIEKVERGEARVPEKLAREMGIKSEQSVVSGQQSVGGPGFAVRGVSLSDDKLALGLAKPTSSGLRWLVEWFIYQLLKAHFLIRKIRGKIVRKRLADSGQQSADGN